MPIEYNRRLKQRKTEDVLTRLKKQPGSDMPPQWNMSGFKDFARRTFPKATDQDVELIALGIYKWFYGDWSQH